MGKDPNRITDAKEPQITTLLDVLDFLKSHPERMVRQLFRHVCFGGILTYGECQMKQKHSDILRALIYS